MVGASVVGAVDVDVEVVVVGRDDVGTDSTVVVVPSPLDVVESSPGLQAAATRTKTITRESCLMGKQTTCRRRRFLLPFGEPLGLIGSCQSLDDLVEIALEH